MLGNIEGREGDNRGWDGWMASPTWWTWVWASSRTWWWTGKPGMLQSMGLQRVGHDWVTELTDWLFYCIYVPHLCSFIGWWTFRLPPCQSNLEREKWSWKKQTLWVQIILQIKNRYISMEQDKKPEINLCNFGQLIYNKGGKTVQWRKDSLFNKWCQENWTATC